jgi:hypothetical protein
MTLWPQLSIDPEETLLSYADRLSLMHTGRGMERLLADLGIHKEHFISGRSDAVALLANAIGASAESLDNIAIRVLQRCASFRGEFISKSFLSPRVARYCPACVRQDGPKSNRRQRIVWGLRHVSRCHKHGVWLVDAPVQDTTNLRVALGGAILEPAHAAAGETPEYLDWIISRTCETTRSQGGWLDQQTIEQVLAASEMLGAVLEKGHGVQVMNLCALETEDVTDIGFSIYREGPDAVTEALDSIRRASPAVAVQAGPLAHYGNLFDWLARRSNVVDPGPICDILRDHIVKHTSVEPGEKVLGVEIKERLRHSVRSLSAEVGIDRPRLCRLLKKLGQIPNDATGVESGNVVFDAAEIVSLIDGFKTAVPMCDLPLYLGATKRQVEILYRAGIIEPLVPSTGRGSVRNVVFAQQHLDDLLAQIHALPEIQSDEELNYQPISYACQRGAGPFDVIFAKILAGSVNCFRSPKRYGIASMYVEVSALLRLKITL